MSTTNLNSEEYGRALKILHSSSSHNEQMVAFIKTKVIPSLVQRQTFLDIGPGPGTITKAVATSFQNTTIIEPNPEYREYFSDTLFTINAANFENYSSIEKFDFSLLSHVLYHVDLQKWPNFIKRFLQTINQRGMGLIAMMAPRSPIHNLFLELNPYYRNSSYALEILKSANVSFQTFPMKYIFPLNSFHDALTLCKFFVLEDCLPLGAYQNMSFEEKSDLEEKIIDFVKDHKLGNGSYELTEEHDCICISGEHPSSSN